MDNSVDFLKTVDIFSLLSEEEIRQITGYLKNHDYRKDHVLFNEGDEGNELFIVHSGSIGSSISLPDGKSREIARFASGDFFGEMSIFENAPRSATCYCKEECSLLSLHEKGFFEIVEKYPEVAMKIMYRMLNITTQRLRDTGEFLSEMVHWGEAARKRAITDELTGAYNRRFLDDSLEHHFESSKTSGKPLSLIMVDLDFFREINEHYGNEVGDSVILEVVKVFNRNLRQKDILARYGGDEFTVLMLETPSQKAINIAENIRKEVGEIDVLTAQKGPITRVTTSLGVATYPEQAESLQSLKELADKSLYSAKEAGRDRVICAGAEI